MLDRGINPSTAYYLLIYTVIFVAHYFKLFRQVNRKPTDVAEQASGAAINAKHYFFLGLEFVYSSAGIVISLIAASTKWMSVVVLGYIVLLLFSAFLDALGDDYPEQKRLVLNLCVIGLVVALTIVFNQTTLFPPAPLETATAPKTQGWRVAIPFRDTTLEAHVGRAWGNRRLVYVTSVKAASRDEAVFRAKQEFSDEHNASLSPFKGAADRGMVLALDSELIVAELSHTEPLRGR